MLYVSCLYILMGSPDFAAREYATREFHHRVSGWPHLYGQFAQRKLGTANPERTARLRRPVAAYRAYLAVQYTPSTVPVWPCIDMMPGTPPEVRDRSAGESYRVEEPSDPPALDAGPYWHRWRRGTENMARTMIRRGSDPKEVDALLSRMWAIELDCESDRPGTRPELESWKQWQGGYPHPEK